VLQRHGNRNTHVTRPTAPKAPARGGPAEQVWVLRARGGAMQQPAAKRLLIGRTVKSTNCGVRRESSPPGGVKVAFAAQETSNTRVEGQDFSATRAVSRKGAAAVAPSRAARPTHARPGRRQLLPRGAGEGQASLRVCTRQL
jgi:3'-phosphoadenosine 5'-phosphosulfate sulfotransferase